MLPPQLPARPLARRQRRRHSLWRLVRANFYDFWLLIRESWVALLSFAALMVVGSAYLVATTDLAFVEALYLTLKLLTFEGGDQLPPDPVGRALFFLIPLLGLALILQSVLNFGRLLLDKGSRREAWQVALASTYHDHVIICGLGRVGFRLATQLLETGYEAVVIERDWGSEFVERVIGMKVPVILGDAREPGVLHQAGLLRARAVVISINDDLLNIEIGLTVRAEHPEARTVLRVFNEELDTNLERSFGPHSAFSTSSLAAPTFALATLSREIDYVLPVEGQLIGVTRQVIEPESRLCGFVRAIEEQNQIRIIAHQRGDGSALRYELMSQINGHDQVVAIGHLEALARLRVHNEPGSKLGFLRPPAPQRTATEYNRVIVCGLGRVGYRVVQQLHGLAPRPEIVVVRQHDTPPDLLRQVAELDGVRTIVGDARDIVVLREAGIEQAYSVAALTSNDLVNLQVGLVVRRYYPDVRLVLRVFSDALAERLSDLFGIHTAYSTSALASSTLAAAALIGGVGHAFYASGRLFSVESVYVRPGDPFAGTTVEALRIRNALLVIGIYRDQEALAMPSHDTIIAPGDRITLLAPIEVLARTRAELIRLSATMQQETPAGVT